MNLIKAGVRNQMCRSYQIQGKGKKKEFAIRLGRILKINRWSRKAVPHGEG